MQRLDARLRVRKRSEIGRGVRARTVILVVTAFFRRRAARGSGEVEIDAIVPGSRAGL